MKKYCINSTNYINSIGCSDALGGLFFSQRLYCLRLLKICSDFRLNKRFRIKLAIHCCDAQRDIIFCLTLSKNIGGGPFWGSQNLVFPRKAGYEIFFFHSISRKVEESGLIRS